MIFVQIFDAMMVRMWASGWGALVGSRSVMSWSAFQPLAVRRSWSSG